MLREIEDVRAERARFGDHGTPSWAAACLTWALRKAHVVDQPQAEGWCGSATLSWAQLCEVCAASRSEVVRTLPGGLLCAGDYTLFAPQGAVALAMAALAEEAAEAVRASRGATAQLGQLFARWEGGPEEDAAEVRRGRPALPRGEAPAVGPVPF